VSTPVTDPEAATTDDAITVVGLTKVYGARAALDNASLAIPRGHITGVVGPNGSG